MAYLIFLRRGAETGRFPLAGPVVVGRSPECDVSVHDILLSRRHCRLEPVRGGWVAVDLDSKNGTKVGGDRITRRGLRDGDVLTAGKTTICFRLGKLDTTAPADPIDAPDDSASPAPSAAGVTFGKRPADPFEALAGTVCAFDAAAVVAAQRRLKLPYPKPIPREPAAYARDDLYSMLTEITSSSWDSIYAGASRPFPTRKPSDRPLPRVAGSVGGPGGGSAIGQVVGQVEPSEDAATFRRFAVRRPARPPSPVRAAAVRTGEPAASRERARPDAPAIAPAGTDAGRVRSATRWMGRLFERARRWVAPAGAVRLL